MLPCRLYVAIGSSLVSFCYHIQSYMYFSVSMDLQIYVTL